MNACREKQVRSWLQFRHWPIPSNRFSTDLRQFTQRLTTAYLAAAQAAKLKGIYASSGAPLKNLSRPDTGQPIFKSVEVNNDMTSGHAWAEIQLSDGRWVPIDPKLVASISLILIDCGQRGMIFELR